MDTIATMRQVIAETTRVVDGIEPSQLDNPSPCENWTVRDVLNHVTGGAEMFAICVDEGSISDEKFGALVSGDNLGTDYKAAFKTASGHALAAFDAPGVLDQMVSLPFGEMPAGVALNIAIFDVTVHAWDLAKGSGQSTALDPGIVASALEAGRQMIGPEMRDGSMFKPAIDVAADAPLPDQLAAFAGRQP
jgi:uncharacterized protein (TIGR03086 family)